MELQSEGMGASEEEILKRNQMAALAHCEDIDGICWEVGYRRIRISGENGEGR